jgi:hypothetical protein
VERIHGWTKPRRGGGAQGGTRVAAGA